MTCDSCHTVAFGFKTHCKFRSGSISCQNVFFFIVLQNSVAKILKSPSLYITRVLDVSRDMGDFSL